MIAPRKASEIVVGDGLTGAGDGHTVAAVASVTLRSVIVLVMQFTDGEHIVVRPGTMLAVVR